MGREGEGSSGEFKRASCWAALRVEMAWDGRDYFEVVWAHAHAHSHAHRGNLQEPRRQDRTGPDENNVQRTGGRPFNLKPATPQNQQGNCKLAEKQFTRRRRC